MVYLKTFLYSDTLALQVNWSGAITVVWDPGRLPALYLGMSQCQGHSPTIINSSCQHVQKFKTKQF